MLNIICIIRSLRRHDEACSCSLGLSVSDTLSVSTSHSSELLLVRLRRIPRLPPILTILPRLQLGPDNGPNRRTLHRIHHAHRQHLTP